MFSGLSGLENVYERKYVPALFLDAAYPLAGLAAALIASAVLGRSVPLWLILPLVILAVATAVYGARKIAQSVHAGRTLRRRRYMPGGGDAVGQAVHDELHATSGRRLLSVDMRTRRLASGDGWQACDVTCDSHSRRFNFVYKSKQSFRTVFKADLGRPAPHFVFDSKLAGRRRFKRVYANGRNLFVTGRLNHFFAVRTADDRQSGVSGLLTPEVKRALLFMKEYDVELVGASLFCYAPLLEESRLEDFLANGRGLRAALAGALEASGGSSGKGGVLVRRLLKNPSVYAPAAAASGGLLAGLSLVAAIAREPGLLISLAAAGLVLSYCLAGMAKTAGRNRRLLRDMAAG